MFLAILYFVETLCQKRYMCVLYKTTKNYNLPKKRQTFTSQDKWLVFFEPCEKRETVKRGGRRKISRSVPRV